MADETPSFADCAHAVWDATFADHANAAEPSVSEPVPADPHPEGNPALAAAVEAIVRRRLSVSHALNPQEARTAILLDALPDAAAALNAAAPLLVADALKSAARETFGDVIRAATDESVHARLAEIEAAVRASERDRILGDDPAAGVYRLGRADGAKAERERTRAALASGDFASLIGDQPS